MVIPDHGDESSNHDKQGGSPRATDPSDLDHTVEMTGPVALSKMNLSGKVIGEYSIFERLGSGGGGQVFKAWHRRMDRHVAFKVLPTPEVTTDVGDPADIKRFQREVKAAAKLLHPNIVTAFDAGQFDQTLYLVMEFVDGESLSSIVNQNGPLSPAEASNYIIQAAKGLDYAHSSHVVHRDVKPSNIMLDSNGTVKILDMGLAKFYELSSASAHRAADDLTESGVFIGTFLYMSPEQATSPHLVDHRTDIYSLGCTFYFLLTGKPVYSGSVAETIAAHTSRPIPRLRDVRGDIHDSYDAVLQHMLAKDPEERYQRMSLVISALESCRTLYRSDIASPAPPTVEPQVASSGDSGTSSRPKVGSVAIDLGTSTCSVAAIAEDDVPKMVPTPEGKSATPSVLLVEKNAVEVGGPVLQEEDRKAEHVFDRLKRDIAQGSYLQQHASRAYPPEVLLALMLRKVIDGAQQRIGFFSHAVLTIPGCFGDVGRKAIQDAADIASFSARDMINESTAIAISFAFNCGWLNPRLSVKKRKIAVFRLGGGSFETAIIRVEGAKFTTLALSGDERLGGCDWDDRLVDVLAQQFIEEHGIDPQEAPNTALRLRRAGERVKNALALKDRVTAQFNTADRQIKTSFTREEFGQMCQDLLDRTKSLTCEALESAAVDWPEIDHLILGGGASQMPMVGEMLSRWSGKEPVGPIADAAVQGAALCGLAYDNRRHAEQLQVQIREVNSQALGIVGSDTSTDDRRKALLIPRNTPLPVSRRYKFKTSQEDQTSARVSIIEGPSASLSEFTEVGFCDIHNLPLAETGERRVSLDFQLAANGRLSVHAESRMTGRRTELEIRRASGLTTWQCSHWRERLDEILLCGDTDVS